MTHLQPTTGLDSYNAGVVMNILKRLADQGVTVVLSIHQPTSNVFQLFDKLLLVASGQVVYFGAAKDAVQHFRQVGYPCPPEYNPADFFSMFSPSSVLLVRVWHLFSRVRW